MFPRIFICLFVCMFACIPETSLLILQFLLNVDILHTFQNIIIPVWRVEFFKKLFAVLNDEE